MSFSIAHIINTLEEDHSSVPKYGQNRHIYCVLKNNYWQNQSSDDHIYILKL